MTISCIAITKVDQALYSWALLYGDEVTATQTGAVKLSDCLAEAFDAIPEGMPHIELKYRGFHMGTFLVEHLLREASETCARHLKGTYGYLMAAQ